VPKNPGLIRQRAKTFDKGIDQWLDSTHWSFRLIECIVNLLRYSVGHADFCRLVQKITVSAIVISGVTEPIFIKFA